jgi:hypothetical protein
MRQTTHAIKELRARALALGIDYDALPPLLRLGDIVRSPKRAHGPPGLLPISARTFYTWVREGLIPPPVKFEAGISAWSRGAIVRIALDGIQRPPGHGRKSGRRLPEKSQTRSTAGPEAGLATT